VVDRITFGAFITSLLRLLVTFAVRGNHLFEHTNGLITLDPKRVELRWVGTACPYLKTCTGSSSIHGTGFKDKLNLCRKKAYSQLLTQFFVQFFLSDMNYFTKFCSTFCSSSEKEVMQI
jgi:hypothetical protein